MATSNIKPPAGFSNDFSGREAPCIGVFGNGGSGKTRFLVTAGEWAQERGTTPGWLVCDRKTRRTVREVCATLNLPLPFINNTDFIDPTSALKITKLDRDKAADNAEIQKVYSEVVRKVIDAAVTLGEDKRIDPVIIETGTQIWDWISFSHFGRKQNNGMARVWGPPKQDWTDLMDGLAHKTVLVSFWEGAVYKDDKRQNWTRPDGPPHLDYTTTTLIGLRHEAKRKLVDGETYVDRFMLDVFKCQENKAIEGEEGLLTGENISYSTFMAYLGTE